MADFCLGNVQRLTELVHYHVEWSNCYRIIDCNIDALLSLTVMVEGWLKRHVSGHSYT